MISFLHQPGRHDPANFRVEVVSTARHYESYYLTRGEGEAIPRGWYRQNDFPSNGVLYDRTLSAGAYQRWLRLMGVRYVFLPITPSSTRPRRPRPRCCAAGTAGCARSRSRRTSAPSSCPDATPMLTLDARAPGRARARGRRARAARDARAVLALAAAAPAPTCCASTTRPTGASTIRRRPASSPARTG